MRTPSQSEIDAFFQGRLSLAREIEATMAEAQRSKKSVKSAVRRCISMQTWKLRAEAHGYQVPEAVRRATAAAAVAVFVFVLSAGFMLLAADAVAREAEWRQERLCRYHSAQVNAYAAQIGRESPCKS